MERNLKIIETWEPFSVDHKRSYVVWLDHSPVACFRKKAHAEIFAKILGDERPESDDGE